MICNALAVLLIALLGCAAQRPSTGWSTVLPRNTAEACASIRAFFAEHRRYSVSPADVTTQCRMRISAEPGLSGPLRQRLEQTGWKADPHYSTAAVPSEFAWEIPTTRCEIEERANPDNGGDDRLNSGARLGGGGSGLAGAGAANRDYLIECADRTTEKP